ncbi:replication initiator protein [Dipodfec virus UOA04_Rod_815]|nr:replication initiator protein [Dipodfec virus UOA04_Rod_815]
MACFHPVIAHEHSAPGDYNQTRSFSFRPSFRSDDVIKFPCGKCIGCRSDRARDWTYRCIMESVTSPPAYFVTLTYSDEEVPLSAGVSLASPALSGSPYPVFDEYGHSVLVPEPSSSVKFHYSLRADDMRLFFMQVTKRLGPVRKLYSGEYGSRTLRPHYHAIIFGLGLDDLKFHSYNDFAQPLFVSESLSRCWYNSRTRRIRGNVLVSEANPSTMAYTAGYTLKKLGSSKRDYEKLGIEPEFIRTSRRPGIGMEFFSQHLDLVYGGAIHIPTPSGSVSVRCPSAFRRIHSSSDPASALWLSMERARFNKFKDELTLSLTDLDEYAIMSIKEMSLKNRRAGFKTVL